MASWRCAGVGLLPRDVEQHGSAAAKPCWASLLETDEQNTEHAENANTNMGKCDDYTISPEKLLG